MYFTYVLRRCSSVSIVTRFRAGVLFPAVGGIFFFATPSSPALGPTTLLSSGYRGLFPHAYCGWGVKLTTHLHLAPRWRMRGSIPPFPHTSSWRGTGTTLRLCVGVQAPVTGCVWTLLLLSIGNRSACPSATSAFRSVDSSASPSTHTHTHTHTQEHERTSTLLEFHPSYLILVSLPSLSSELHSS
jgi:hypothetical protein